jgi:hypothetical protein
MRSRGQAGPLMDADRDKVTIRRGQPVACIVRGRILYIRDEDIPQRATMHVI